MISNCIVWFLDFRPVVPPKIKQNNWNKQGGLVITETNLYVQHAASESTRPAPVAL